MTWQWHGHAVTGDGVRIVYTVHEPTDDSRSSGALCKDAQAPPRLPILVCRGWGMVKEDSAGLARAISTAWDRPVIVVDNRGSGESVIGLEGVISSGHHNSSHQFFFQEYVTDLPSSPFHHHQLVHHPLPCPHVQAHIILHHCTSITHVGRCMCVSNLNIALISHVQPVLTWRPSQTTVPQWPTP